MSDDRSPVDDMTRRALALAVSKQRQRITELEAELERLRAERWEPVDKATLMPHDDMGYVMRYADGGSFEVGDSFYELPTDMRLCRKEARHD